MQANNRLRIPEKEYIWSESYLKRGKVFKGRVLEFFKYSEKDRESKKAELFKKLSEKTLPSALKEGFQKELKNLQYFSGRKWTPLIDYFLRYAVRALSGNFRDTEFSNRYNLYLQIYKDGDAYARKVFGYQYKPIIKKPCRFYTPVDDEYMGRIVLTRIRAFVNAVVNDNEISIDTEPVEFDQALSSLVVKLSRSGYKNFKYLSLVGLDFSNVIFEGCDFSHVYFDSVNLENTVFKGCNLSRSSFNTDKISNCKLIDITGENIEYAEFLSKNIALEMGVSQADISKVNIVNKPLRTILHEKVFSLSDGSKKLSAEELSALQNRLITVVAKFKEKEIKCPVDLQCYITLEDMVDLTKACVVTSVDAKVVNFYYAPSLWLFFMDRMYKKDQGDNLKCPRSIPINNLNFLSLEQLDTLIFKLEGELILEDKEKQLKSMLHEKVFSLSDESKKLSAEELSALQNRLTSIVGKFKEKEIECPVDLQCHITLEDMVDLTKACVVTSVNTKMVNFYDAQSLLQHFINEIDKKNSNLKCPKSNQINNLIFLSLGQLNMLISKLEN